MIKRWVKIEKCNKPSLKSIKGFIYFLLEGVIFFKKNRFERKERDGGKLKFFKKFEIFFKIL